MCMYQKNSSVNWDILWFTTRELHNYFIPYATENAVANKVSVKNTQCIIGKLDVIPLNITAFL